MGHDFQGERPEKGIEGDKLLAEYAGHLRAAGLRSAATYLATLEAFRLFCAEGGVALLGVRASDIDAYRGTLLVGGRSRATVNNATNRIKRFYRWAYKRRLVSVDPFFGFKSLSTGRSLPKTILAIPDMGKFLQFFALRSDRDFMLKSVVELLYGSALRISEVETLHVGDIDFDTGVILINERKTGVARKVPASEASLKAVKLYLELSWRNSTDEEDRAEGFLYPQKGSTTLRCLLNAKLARECRRLGLKRITSHSFRHAAATHLLQSGAGIRAVQAFLGHKDISSTERYTHVVTQDLKAVIEACHPRETSP